MNKNNIITTALLVTLLLAGCGTFEFGLETTITPGADSPITLVTPTDTAEPTPVPPVPFSYADLPYGPSYGPEYVGLVYHDDEGVWVVDVDGQARFIGERTIYPELSPDGSQMLYTSDEGMVLWLKDLNTGEARILDDSVNLMKGGYAWWPARPEIIVYYLTDPMEPRGGSLHALNLETGEKRTLDAESPSNFAPSPDGETLLLGSREYLRFYSWDGGGEEYLVAEDYGLDGWNLFQPAWSPNGDKVSIFGSRYDETEGNVEISLFVLDLQSKTATTLHNYQAYLGSEYPWETTWSPDGNWVTATTFGELGGRIPSVWIISADGAEKHQFPRFISPHWRPDSMQVISWKGPEPDSEDTSYLAYKMILVEIGVWEPVEFPAPAGSVAEAWLGRP